MDIILVVDMRVKLEISYVGDEFCGWQIQPERRTVQGELLRALKSLTGEEPIITGSGRTDTGVHALCQVAHFDLTRNFEIKKIKSGLNFYLPQSIRILSAIEVDESFHARFSAKSKAYEYVFSTSDNALYVSRALYAPDLDYGKMAEAVGVLKGRHDFSAFRSLGSDTKTTVREIFDLSLTARGDFFVLKVVADGFLYNMVRKIAGMLIRVGEGKLDADGLREILLSKDNARTPVAPAHALYLSSVEY